MRVLLVGATGNSGSRILKELIARGHKVTAVARDTTKVTAVARDTTKLPPEVESRQDDLSNVDSIAATTLHHTMIRTN